MMNYNDGCQMKLEKVEKLDKNFSHQLRSISVRSPRRFDSYPVRFESSLSVYSLVQQYNSIK